MKDYINDCSLGGICGGCFYHTQKNTTGTKISAAKKTDAVTDCADIARCSTKKRDAAGSIAPTDSEPVTESKQRQIKSEHVHALLDEAVAPYGYDYRYEGITASPLIFGYRNKMEYSFGDCIKNGPLTLGLHQKKSFYNVIDVDDCRLVHNDFNLVVKCVADYFRSTGLTYYDKKSHLGYLRYLIIRRAVNRGEMLIDLVTTSQPLIRVNNHRDICELSLYEREAYAAGRIAAAEGVETLNESAVLEGFKDRLLRLAETDAFAGTIKGILHTVNDSLSDAVRNDGTSVLCGEDYITEEILGLKFKISPFSFFQTNTKGAELLYSKVREYISDELKTDMSLFDLYSGTGTIAQVLAPSVSQVTGVEIVAEAVEAAKENAAANGLTNCTFIADDVLKALDSLPAPDIIILDPPRDGVNPKALRKIIDYGVEHMIYVSCKIESLARDMAMLQESGYHLIRAATVDQFPWTKNVETVALMTKVQN